MPASASLEGQEGEVTGWLLQVFGGQKSKHFALGGVRVLTKSGWNGRSWSRLVGWSAWCLGWMVCWLGREGIGWLISWVGWLIGLLVRIIKELDSERSLAAVFCCCCLFVCVARDFCCWTVILN